MKTTLLIFFLVTGIPASIQFKQRHDLEERAVTAARTLHEIYILTPNQSVRLVYMNAWQGNACVEYVVDDARAQSFIKYAVFEKDSKFVNYDLDQDDIEDRCSMAGVDLTKVAEKELKEESENGGAKRIPASLGPRGWSSRTGPVPTLTVSELSGPARLSVRVCAYASSRHHLRQKERECV